MGNQILEAGNFAARHLDSSSNVSLAAQFYRRAKLALAELDGDFAENYDVFGRALAVGGISLPDVTERRSDYDTFDAEVAHRIELADGSSIVTREAVRYPREDGQPEYICVAIGVGIHLDWYGDAHVQHNAGEAPAEFIFATRADWGRSATQ